MSNDQILKFAVPVVVAVARDLYGFLLARAEAEEKNDPLPPFKTWHFAASVLMGIVGGLGLNVQFG